MYNYNIYIIFFVTKLTILYSLTCGPNHWCVSGREVSRLGLGHLWDNAVSKGDTSSKALSVVHCGYRDCNLLVSTGRVHSVDPKPKTFTLYHSSSTTLWAKLGYNSAQVKPQFRFFCYNRNCFPVAVHIDVHIAALHRSQGTS